MKKIHSGKSQQLGIILQQTKENRKSFYILKDMHLMKNQSKNKL